MLSDAQRALVAERLRRDRRPGSSADPTNHGGAGNGVANSSHGSIRRRPVDVGPLPLSFGQEQLWFLDRFAPGLPTYNIPQAFRISGPLDVSALQRALDRLIARHEALRTCFVTDEEGRPRQEILEPLPLALAQSDLSVRVPEAEREVALAELCANEAVRPFVLSEAPLLRAHLAKLADQEHLLIIVVHHIVFDGASVAVFLNELASLYNAESTACPSTVPAELPVQFADYALWERERLADESAAGRLLEYWRSTMQGFETLDIATDRPRPAVDSFDGAVERLNLGAEAWAGVRRLASRGQSTPFAVLMTVLQSVLQRYTGQDDVVVGTFSANRARSELAPLLGYLVNTLPIRTDLSGDPAFTEALSRVRTSTLGAFAHQDLPFAKLVELLGIQRDPSRAPVFQVAMTMAEFPEPVQMGGGPTTLRLVKIDLPASKFDLIFLFEIIDGELWVETTFTTDLFDASTARRLLAHIGVLLDGAVADPTRRLSQLPMLSEEELRRELVEWNDTAIKVPTQCIHELFEQQVRRTPDAVAAEFDGSTVTYAELNAQAHRIARHLRVLGAGPEALVGISMAPSIRRLATVLGILKSGAGYVPLDPALPAERLAYMKADTGMSIVLTEDDDVADVLESVEAGTSADVNTSDDLGVPVRPSNTAYVIYTSGSTGAPKGVVVEHRNVVNHAFGMIERFGIGPDDKVLQFASLNFDVSVMDMFTALLSGARAVIVGAQTRLSPPRLAALLRDCHVSVAGLPPAVAGLLAGERYPELRMLMIAGEAVPAELAKAWSRPGLMLVNGYGPTEDTVIATLAELGGTEPVPPIGLPVLNAQAYVLDRYLNPMPTGAVGELHMGGAGVARGYLNAPALTRERFVPDPFRPDVPGARLYKTGDFVRRLPDGRIVFVGRRDGQVKIRGLRLELGEVEAALLAQDGVGQAVVLVAEDPAGEKHLIGYVRPESQNAAHTDTSLDPDILRDALARRLPAYMVPSHILLLDQFPINASGKVDKKALPAFDFTASASAGEGATPRTILETVLVDMFGRLIGRDTVGADVGFFDLGGNSLQAMQLVTLMRDELAVDADVTDVFVAPSARQLSALLSDKHGLEDADLGESGVAGLSDDETAALLSALD